MLKIDDTLTLLNCKTIELYPLSEDVFERECVQVYTDMELFASNAHLLLSNANLIIENSRLFLAPIDMGCSLEYSGKLKPITLGAYIEWWQNYPSSRDCKGNPLIQVVGSPLTGTNKCMSVTPDGSLHEVSVPDFNATFHSFLSVSSRYRTYIYKFATYSFEKVIEILREKGSRDQQTDSNLDYFTLNKSLLKTADEYLISVLSPRIQAAKSLYHICKRVYDYMNERIREQDRIIEETKQKYRKGEITMQFYRSIRKAAETNKAQIISRLNNWWLFHFIKYYYERS